MKIYFLIAVTFIAGCIQAQTKISFKDSAFYPEGIAYNNSDKCFYVGSVKTGTISKVDANGNKTNFYVDPALKSSFGMKVDAANNLLWVCTGDPNYSIYQTPETFKQLARLIAIDLTSGKKMKDLNLAALYGGSHFINDLVMDGKGNMYVTDSYSPVIYKINQQGEGTVLTENKMFKSLDIGLNGIAYNSKGFLLTVNNGSGSVLKVDPATKAVSKVKIGQFFPGADGLIMLNDNELLLVQNKGVDKIFKLRSDDNWQTAKVMSATSTEDRFQNPSTATLKGNEVYVINAKLNEITDRSKKPSESFIIQQALLKPVQ